MADVLSLEEIENSAAFGIDRDTALRDLVTALNADAGRHTWAYVPSPSRVPEVEDVIRTAFIYRTSAVKPVKESTILDDPAFDNAREPLAQEFRPRQSGSKHDFVVIVNHFKSKGSGTGEDADQGDGQGASNASRVKQARALVGFADAQRRAAKTDTVFLTGDFNAYNEEDPVEVIEDAGYVNVPRALTDKETYQFDGLIGSLDHVFASRPGLRAGDGRRHLEHQRLRVRRRASTAGTTPTSRTSTRRGRTVPATTTPRSSASADRDDGLMNEVVTVVAVVLAGLFAGLFVTFSYGIMPGLRHADDSTFVHAMREINVGILNAMLAIIFGGGTLAAIAAAVVGFDDKDARWWLVAGAVLVVATTVVTMVVNVPMNDRLVAGVDAGEPPTALREAFEEPWIRWNIARSVLSTAGFVALLVALLV